MKTKAEEILLNVLKKSGFKPNSESDYLVLKKNALIAMEEYKDNSHAWIPVTERLPLGLNVRCLVSDHFGTYYAEFLNSEFIDTTDLKRTAFIGITHWMPLPPSPNQ